MPDSRRLVTSKEAYDRIRWDDAFEARWFSVVYEDRQQGIVSVPFASFDPDGDVPWHRVQGFRCGDMLIWDRATRLDRVELGRSPGNAARPKRPAPENVGSLETLVKRAAAEPSGRTVAWVCLRPLLRYPSFVQEISADVGADHEEALLRVDLRSYATEWSGNERHVGITYAFDTVDALIAYVEQRYDRAVADWTFGPPPLPEDLPVEGTYPVALLPSFDRAWRELRDDFDQGELDDPSLVARQRSR